MPLGTAGFTIWQGWFPHTAAVAWHAPSTACIPLKCSSCTWTAELMQAAEVSPECATLLVQTPVPAAGNTSGATRPCCKSIPLTRKCGVGIAKSLKCQTCNQPFQKSCYTFDGNCHETPLTNFIWRWKSQNSPKQHSSCTERFLCVLQTLFATSVSKEDSDYKHCLKTHVELEMQLVETGKVKDRHKQCRKCVGKEPHVYAFSKLIPSYPSIGKHYLKFQKGWFYA